MRRHLLFTTLSAIGASLALTAAAPAAAETVKVHLKGFEEVPSVSTAASGELRLKINDKKGVIEYDLDYENLKGVTQAHIHFAQKGVNGSIVIWLCQTEANPAPPAVASPSLTPFCPTSDSGSVSGTITAANVIATNIAAQQIAAGELDEVIAAIRAGVAYGNVHTSISPGGELRGQLH